MSCFTGKALLVCMIFGLYLSGCDGSSGSTGSLNSQDENAVNPTCQVIDLAGGNAEIEIKRVFPGISLNQPIAMIQAPNDSARWYVAERGGVILSFSESDSQAVQVADLGSRIKSSGLEQGLLGIAFHPNYPVVPKLYVSYNDTDGNSVISTFLLDSGLQKLDHDSEQVVLTQTQPFSNHNGGGIAFGPDGYLYIGFGDGGSGGDPQNNAQNTSNWLGAMLRIDVRETPYVIPKDNPFSASPGCSSSSPCPEIWAWGLRNPWRWSFDRETGNLWAGDVGQNQWEEISLLESGGNYGWRCYEGSHEFNLDGCKDPSSYRFPIAEYSHADGQSVTGGYVYRGMDIPLLRGKYLYADFLSGHIWGIDVANKNSQPVRLIESSGLNIASFTQSLEDELFLIDFNGGIYQLSSCGVN